MFEIVELAEVEPIARQNLVVCIIKTFNTFF